MIIQIIIENQSRAVNHMKIHSLIFHKSHGTIAGILLQNDYGVTGAIKIQKKASTFMIMRTLSFKTVKNCPQKVTKNIFVEGGSHMQDATGKREMTSNE